MAIRFRKGMKLEELYPNGRCRQAADAAIDALDPSKTTISEMLDSWDAAYVAAGGKSPWRKP